MEVESRTILPGDEAQDELVENIHLRPFAGADLAVGLFIELNGLEGSGHLLAGVVESDALP